jgi:hypothetical protein
MAMVPVIYSISDICCAVSDRSGWCIGFESQVEGFLVKFGPPNKALQ